MPDKEGSEDKTTKSVVSKKQKQMMGEEGYDVARDQGRVRPSKDKKDATTMPVSKEIKKTRKVNKGPSALELVKKKYKGQIMDELDLSKVAESFGGYITEVEIKGKGPIKKIVTDLKKKGKIDPEADTPVGNEIAPNVQTSGTQKPKRGAKKMSGQRNIFTGKPELKTAKTTYNKPKKKLAPKPADGQLSLDLNKTPKPKPTPAMSGGKVKGTPKGPTLKPTTSGRNIEKKFSSSQPSTTTQKGLDIYKAGGPYVPDKTTFTGTGKSAPRMEPKPKGMTPTLPVKPSRTPIPKDTGSLKDAPKVKKQFGDFRKKLDALKTDIKVDKDIEKTISKVGSGKKISKTADFSSTSQRTGAMKRGTDFVKSMKKKGGEALSKVSKAVSGTGASAGLAKVGGGKAVEKAALKKVGQKAVQKAGTKAATKAVAKSALKAIPGIGAFVSGAEAAGRIATGDLKGAALSAGEAIPGVGLGFAAANVARDVGRAKKAAKAIKTVSATQKLPKAMKRIPKGPITKMPRGTKTVSVGKGMEIVKPGSDTIQKVPTGGISRKTVGRIAGGTAAYTAQKGAKGELPDLKMKGVKGGRTGFRSAK